MRDASMNIRIRIAFVIAFFALASQPLRASATPPDLLGYGPRHISMGQTGVSFASDYEAVFSNPAGLGRAKTTGLRIGMLFAPYSLQLDGAPFVSPDVTGAMKEADTASGMMIGFQLPLPFGKPLKDVLTLGAGFYTPNNAVLRVDLPYTDIPQWPVLGRAHSVAINVGFGVDLSQWVPGLRLGVGTSALAAIVGRLTVRIDDAERFTSQTENQIIADFAPIAGVSYDHKDFRFGLSYRGETRAEIDLRVNVEGFPIEFPEITITALAQYAPHTLAAEAAWVYDDRLLIALNLTWRRWSAYPGTLGKTTEQSHLPPAPDFGDTVSPRLGAEYTHHHGAFRIMGRGGYLFEPTPSPPARIADRRNYLGDDPSGRAVALRYLDSHRHILSLGFGFDWHSKSGAILNGDLFFSPQRISKRTHEIGQVTPVEAAERDVAASVSNMVSHGWIFTSGLALGVSW